MSLPTKAVINQVQGFIVCLIISRKSCIPFVPFHSDTFRFKMDLDKQVGELIVPQQLFHP